MSRTVCIWTTADIVAACPLCKVWAVVKLPEWLRAEQPDGTTYVCHPWFGGCNYGFEEEEAP